MELTVITYDNNKKLNFKVSDDPVRPELDLEFRLSPGRTVYALTEDGEYKAAICLAYCNDVPTTVKELDKLSQATINGTHSSIAVAYTVWSKKPRAGRKIITDLMEIIKKDDTVHRLVTLSPKTAMAKRFHLNNGAFVLQLNTETDNYEYPTF
jgi:hypothetical protein|tara:strand:+ start:103 stop:561 length:459 start_codon:yes stop_codon:yes gene_type:complete